MSARGTATTSRGRRRAEPRGLGALHRRARDLGQGKVFVLGIGAVLAVGSTMVGLTWASNSKAPSVQVATSPLPSTVPGTCTVLTTGGRPIGMDVDRARTITMIAGVATQVDAVPVQAARAIDLALSDPKHYLPTVNQTLRLLAREDASEPSAESLALLEALSTPAALTCVFDENSEKAEKKGRNGLTPRAEAVRTGIVDAFGPRKTSGYGSSAAKDDAVEKAGRALEISVKKGSKVDRETGWVMAHWLVARGASYRLGDLTFDDHTWRPDSGWKAQPAPPKAADLPGDTAVDRAAQKAAQDAQQGRQRDSVLVRVEKGR
jgi:hypothetical protein